MTFLDFVLIRERAVLAAFLNFKSVTVTAIYDIFEVAAVTLSSIFQGLDFDRSL